MNKKIFVVVSIIATALIVLVSFTSITAAQPIESIKEGASIFQLIKDKIANKLWYFGGFIFSLFILLLIILDFILYGGRIPA